LNVDSAPGEACRGEHCVTAGFPRRLPPPRAIDGGNPRRLPCGSGQDILRHPGPAEFHDSDHQDQQQRERKGELDQALSPRMIADAYRKRWQVELFFKWIKQHLRIKAFYGTSANAVKTQIWIAVIVYLVVAIVKKRLHLPGSLHTLLQIMEVNLFGS
jgi:hypothetical protein